MLPPLPDLFKTPLTGLSVSSKQDWLEKAVPELKECFQRFIYGDFPPALPSVSLAETRLDAELTNITIDCGERTINLLLATNPHVTAPVPVFLVLNSFGNHTIDENPVIPISQSPINTQILREQNCSGTIAPRGFHASRFPYKAVLKAGYAFATFHESDIKPDLEEQTEVIVSWAWGLQRAVDILCQHPRVDHTKIIVTGHSRRGKAALLAAAFDGRIAVVIPHQSGTGGATPSRSDMGETVRQINDRFPHWFCDRFKEYNDREAELPVDQHQLIALCAPRPVLLTNASEDLWADPQGARRAAIAASPAYELFGQKGFGERLQWIIRDGTHSLTQEDWEIFIRFTNHVLRADA